MTKRKVSRRKQRRQELEQQKRRRTLQIGIPLAMIAIISIVLIALRVTGTSIAGVLEFGPQSQTHDAGVVIEASDLPPVGGVHDPRWQNCGIYEQPVEAKHAIHSMEHGAVWITYQPSLPAVEVSILQELVRGQSYVLLSPYPGLKSPVVLTAWGVQLEVDSAGDERVERFIDQYRLGPQTPEFGAPCDEGIGSPSG